MTIPAPCCASCESRSTEPHCRNKLCSWIRCLKCKAVTAVVNGKRRYYGGEDRSKQI